MRLGNGQASLLVALLLVGCAPAPSAPRPPRLIVPGDYALARPAPGHQQHLGAGVLADGGVLADVKPVRCRDCHALADAGFDAPTSDVCRACHAPQERQHHPLDGGAGLSCLSCHPFMAKQLPARFERWSCLDCHAVEQAGHAPVQVHRSECEACHRPHQTPFTEAASCVQCHDVALSHGKRGGTLAERCSDCHRPHTAATAASQQCATCHQKATMPAAARVAPDALFAKGHTGCGSCHQAHRFERAAVKPCSACHEAQPVLAAAAHDCVSCHAPHQGRAAAVGCTERCHAIEKATLEHPASSKGAPCQGCHRPHEPGAPTAQPCTACHDGPVFTAKVVHGDALGCDDCHSPHGGKASATAECASCHSSAFASVALMTAKKPGTRQSGHARCADCHRQLPHGQVTPPAACLDCHQGQAPLVEKHAACTSCHQQHSGELVKGCTDCHAVATLPALHTVPQHQTCQTCHSAHRLAAGAVVGSAKPQTCKTCHPLLPKKEHPVPPKECASCHLFRAVGE